MEANKIRTVNTNTPSEPTKLNLTNRTDINKILAYSARNKRTNPPPPYSILNPETSSDSPSAKSKGARLVSAMILLIKIIHKGKNMSIYVNPVFISVILNLDDKKTTNNTIKTNLTSYEIVCAIARIAPKKAYFLLEAQPDIITPNTFNDDKTKKIRIDMLLIFIAKDLGNIIQNIIANPKANIGLTQYIILLDLYGVNISFVKSFTASEIGCKSPITPTILGPLRT